MEVMGGTQVSCSKIAPTETCGEIGSNQTVEWKFNNEGETESPLVECTYDATTFDLDDVIEYENRYGQDAGYDIVVMPNFCFQESTTCVVDPKTNNPWKTCPNILDSTTQTGVTHTLSLCEYLI